MEIPSDSESPCLEKLQREVFICLNTFPEKVTALNSLIDDYTPDSIKKSRGNVTQQPAPSCLSINSTTRDYYFHDARSFCSATTWSRCKTRNGISRRKYRPYLLRRRSRPLANILATMINRLAICTQAMFIKPSKYIIDSMMAIFLQREQLRDVQCGTSTVWNSLNCRDNGSLLNSLILTMRPAAVRLIADTTILKRWLQALAHVSNPPNPSLSQAIRTTETIDGWAYELFFHLKYLQVINFPCQMVKEPPKFPDDELTREVEPAGAKFIPESDISLTDDVMHTNLWHRIVQLRDHYVILFETLRSNSEFLETVAEESNNISPLSD